MMCFPLICDSLHCDPIENSNNEKDTDNASAFPMGLPKQKPLLEAN